MDQDPFFCRIRHESLFERGKPKLTGMPYIFGNVPSDDLDNKSRPVISDKALATTKHTDIIPDEKPFTTPIMSVSRKLPRNEDKIPTFSHVSNQNTCMPANTETHPQGTEWRSYSREDEYNSQLLKKYCSQISINKESLNLSTMSDEYRLAKDMFELENDSNFAVLTENIATVTSKKSDKQNLYGDITFSEETQYGTQTCFSKPGSNSATKKHGGDIPRPPTFIAGTKNQTYRQDPGVQTINDVQIKTQTVKPKVLECLMGLI